MPVSLEGRFLQNRWQRKLKKKCHIGVRLLVSLPVSDVLHAVMANMAKSQIPMFTNTMQNTQL